MNIYIAAPFFKPEQLDMVVRIEKALEKAGIDYFSPRSEGVLINMTPEEKEKRMTDIFDSNVMNILKADCILAVIDDWDTGTVWEMGFAYGYQQAIFTISDKDYGLNIMVRQSVLAHNTKIENLITNLQQWEEDDILTNFEELSKDVT